MIPLHRVMSEQIALRVMIYLVIEHRDDNKQINAELDIEKSKRINDWINYNFPSISDRGRKNHLRWLLTYNRVTSHRSLMTVMQNMSRRRCKVFYKKYAAPFIAGSYYTSRQVQCDLMLSKMCGGIYEM